MRRSVFAILLCVTGPCGAGADPLDESLQPFCTQIGIAAVACKCAGDVMRRTIPANELDVILRFARDELSPQEVAKLPDGGAALRGKFIDSWQKAQMECGVKP